MEEQPEVPITRSIESDNSEPTLRFPRPQVNRQLASWISSSQTDIMQPLYPPEDAALSDSTFELINTDDESQDGRATESISSFDYARADDVHSLAGTEHTNADTGDRTDTDSEAEEDEALNGSRASSIQYAEQSLENPSSRVPTPVGYEHASDTANTPLMQSIEFQEAEGPIHLQKVSVKHTIRDFNAEESAALLSGLDMTNPPERLIGTIRQTMAQSCLSTREPLRILYTGSLVARHDIIYKISSAYMASSCSDKADDDGYLYNVVPISSFGSPKEPEVELMMTSQYQIKVDVCKSAKVIVYEGQSFPGETVYSITIGDKTYKSAYCPSGSVIEPVWTLPHIAVFYVTDNDDEETRGTRNAAWQFMRRHLVPCILVSNSQSFKQPHSVTDEWRQNIDQHAIHLCLESRDSLRQIELIRLPIDLSSFLNIDARQMNRNLAYLTGLHEPAGSRLGNGADSVLLKPAQRFREWWYGLSQHVVRHQASSLSAAIGLILGSLIWAFLLRFAISRYGANIAPLSSPTCSHTGGVMSTSDLQSSSISISTSTVTINLTSTKTVRISQANASPSNTGVIPFVGFLSDIHELHKGTVCSTEVYSKNEILVKIPLSTKTSWLAKDSITIDVFRGNDAIKTKFSSIDEGIIIEIPSSEAYGVLNISVNTTRRPKVNETFEVDFGKGRLGEALDFGVHLAQDFGGRILDAAHEAARRVEASVPTLGSLTDGMVAKVVEAGEAAHEFSARFGAQATNHFKGSLNSDAMAKRWKSVREEADRQARRAEDLSAQLDLSILRAQVASRLWWLKIQRKTEEHDRYQQRAEVYVAQKYQEAFKARRERADMEKKELRARRKKERLEARCQSGFSRWTKQCKQDA